MGVMRKTFYNRLKDKYPNLVIENTYGYITKSKRIDARLEKTHATDAFCIANNMKAKRTDDFYEMKKVRRHNRKLHKFKILKDSTRRNNQSPFMVNGFRLFDKVKYKGKEIFIVGRRSRGDSKGRFKLRTLKGDIVHASINYKRLKLLEQRGGYLIELSRA